MKPRTMAATAVFAILASTMCQAAENGAGGVWLNMGGVSHHFSDVKYNDRNRGLGIEAPMGGLLVGVGMYDNSVGRVSRYVVAEKCVWGRVGHGGVCLGALAGMVDGYLLNGGDFVPMAAATLTAEWHRLGTRVLFVPGVENVTAPVVSMQFRLRIN